MTEKEAQTAFFVLCEVVADQARTIAEQKAIIEDLNHKLDDGPTFDFGDFERQSNGRDGFKQ